MAPRVSNVRTGAASTEAPAAAPSLVEQVKADANRIERETDDLGRVIGVRRLNFLEKHRITLLLGDDALNTAALSHVVVAASVTEIDGEPVPPPRTRLQIEAVMSRLDDAGMGAAYVAVGRVSAAATLSHDAEAAAKN